MNSYDIRIPYVEVRDRDRNIIGIIEGAEIFFEYTFHNCGEFEIYCRATQNNLALLKKDNYITLPVNADPTVNRIEPCCNIWIIEKIERTNSRTGGRWITASGKEAKQIVDRRIIKTMQILNNGKNLVSEIKTKLFDKNLTINDENDPRKIKGFIFAESTVDTVVEGETQVTYSNLFDYSEELYLKYEIGAKLRLNRDTKEMLYTIYKGEDRSNNLVFSRGNENLLSTNYIEDWTEYKTGGLVGGEEDDTTKIRKVISLTDNTKDIDRREVFIDARDLSSSYEENGTTKTYPVSQYESMLKERGLERLVAENNKRIEFTGEIDVTNDRYVFNSDYYLGDIVKIRDDDFGTEIKVRVSKFIKVQNDEGYKEYFEYENYDRYSLTIKFLTEDEDVGLQYNIDNKEEINGGLYYLYIEGDTDFENVKSIQFRNNSMEYSYIITSISGTQFSTETLSNELDESSRILLNSDTVISITSILK